MKKEWKLHRSLSVNSSIDGVYDSIHQHLVKKINSLGKSHYTIGISGGSCLEMLIGIMRDDDDWWKPDKCTFFCCDERFLTRESHVSNHGEFIRMLNGKDIKAIWPDVENGSVEECAAKYDHIMTQKYPDGFDVVFLGIGPDGHTASIFPGKG
ncbi:hypothetical protein ACOME3_005435 [Neoechinorhynchus agilis]